MTKINEKEKVGNSLKIKSQPQMHHMDFFVLPVVTSETCDP